jgi:Ca-activated chloride channel family protein
MSFQSPQLLLALVAVPAVLAAYALARRRRQRYAVRFPAVATLAKLVDPVPRWRRHLPPALFALALCALAIALARPETTVAVPRERASVLLVTDVSGSMRATDVEPSRLDAAKAAALDFIDEVPDGIELGAVAFSHFAHTLEQPGDDRARVKAVIEGLSADGGTATGEALSEALALLGPAQESGRPPAAIVLLSDGETTTGRDPVEVAREAREARVPVYTVALGTSGGVIETPSGRLPVPPDPETMREIARVSDGRAYAADDAGGLSELYERLGSRITTKDEEREITAGFAAGGLVLLLAAAGTSLRRYGRLP